MYMANRDIKLMIKELGFTQAQVAKEMGISYSYFTKLLQIPLNPCFKQKTNTAIRRLLRKRKAQQEEVVQWLNNPKSGLLGKDWYKNNAKK